MSWFASLYQKLSGLLGLSNDVSNGSGQDATRHAQSVNDVTDPQQDSTSTDPPPVDRLLGGNPNIDGVDGAHSLLQDPVVSSPLCVAERGVQPLSKSRPDDENLFVSVGAMSLHSELQHPVISSSLCTVERGVLPPSKSDPDNEDSQSVSGRAISSRNECSASGENTTNSNSTPTPTQSTSGLLHAQNSEDLSLLAKIRIWLPPHLKQQHTDALIIHSDCDEDYAAAVSLKDAIGAITSDRIRGSAALVDDTAEYVTSHVDWLEHAIRLHTYTLVIFTEHLLANPRLKNMAGASFWETVTTANKKYCFLPVYTAAAGPSELQLSQYVKALNGIRMNGSGSWTNRLQKIIRDRIGDKVMRQEKQKEEQKCYIRDNLPELYQSWMAADFPDLAYD